ncbi:2S albumin seed storage protein-like [Mangifera indica]|uniref:2S albumin seed storage protein-like n=1 Tax=Mangifera indica TaxID=29780 RepID=UPI001CFAAC54|nr:2S albumin seed storage protein-like [Mangifera indica]
MTKLPLLLSAFAVLLLLANASIYRTTVEVEESSSRGQSCQRQFEEQDRFRYCQRFVQQEILGNGRRNQKQENFKQCCKELQEVDRRCRCQGLEQMVRQQLQQEQLREEEVKELYETASELPRMCNISPSQGCQFHSSY